MTVHSFPNKSRLHPVKSLVKAEHGFIDGADDLRPCKAVIIAALFSLPFWILIGWVLA